MKELENLTHYQTNKLEYISEIISLNQKQTKTNVIELLEKFNQLQILTTKDLKLKYIEELNSLNLKGLEFQLYGDDILLTTSNIDKFIQNHKKYRFKVDLVMIESQSCPSTDYEIDLSLTTATQIEITHITNLTTLSIPETTTKLNLEYSTNLETLNIPDSLIELRIDQMEVDIYKIREFKFNDLNLNNIRTLELLNFNCLNTLTQSFQTSLNVENLLISGSCSDQDKEKINIGVINYLFPNLKTLHVYENHTTDFSKLPYSVDTLIIQEYGENFKELNYLWQQKYISQKDKEKIKKTYKIPDTVKNLEFNNKKIFKI